MLCKQFSLIHDNNFCDKWRVNFSSQYYAKQELLDVDRHSSITQRTLAPFIQQTPTPTSSIDAGSLATFSKTNMIILCVHIIVCMASSLLQPSPSYSTGLPQSPSPSSGKRNQTQCCISDIGSATIVPPQKNGSGPEQVVAIAVSVTVTGRHLQISVLLWCLHELLQVW